MQSIKPIEKLKVSNDQEMVQSDSKSHPQKSRCEKKKKTISTMVLMRKLNSQGNKFANIKKNKFWRILLIYSKPTLHPV